MSELYQRAIICIGCNTECETNMSLACQELEKRFPDIKCSNPVWTSPINFRNPALFLNRTAYFYTPLSAEEVKSIFKEIECLCERKEGDKDKGIVRMDIDLLAYGDKILKTEDWERSYIVDGLKELNI